MAITSLNGMMLVECLQINKNTVMGFMSIPLSMWSIKLNLMVVFVSAWTSFR